MNESDIKSQSYIDQDLKTMLDNDVPTKKWVAAGSNSCKICADNQDQGFIDVKAKFKSGHQSPLAHESCECYLDAGEIDLDSIKVF
jgi:hypothetical protein